MFCFYYSSSSSRTHDLNTSHRVFAFPCPTPRPDTYISLLGPLPGSRTSGDDDGRLPRLISEAVALTVRVVAAQNAAVAKLQAALEAGEVAAVEEVCA